MAKVSANISIDAEVKKQAQELFAQLGMDLSTAVNIFLRQSIRSQSIPFVITTEVPNDTTLSAMDEYNEMLSHPEKYKRYSSFKDALSEVIADA